MSKPADTAIVGSYRCGCRITAPVASNKPARTFPSASIDWCSLHKNAAALRQWVDDNFVGEDSAPPTELLT